MLMPERLHLPQGLLIDYHIFSLISHSIFFTMRILWNFVINFVFLFCPGFILLLVFCNRMSQICGATVSWNLFILVLLHRKIRHGFGDQQESAEQAPPARKGPIKLPTKVEPEPPSKPVRQPEPEPEPEQEEVTLRADISGTRME